MGPQEALRVLALVLTPARFLRPRRTTRPVVDLGPWSERRITGPRGGEHRYLFLPGPSSDAPAFLLLPGAMVDHRIWLNSAELGRRFRVFALDYPEESVHFRGELEGFGDLVGDFLDAIGIRRLHLAGVSAGALVAIDVATRLAARVEVESLHLVSCNLMGIDREEMRTRARLSKWGLSMPPEKMRAIIESLAARTVTRTDDSVVQLEDFAYVRTAAYYRELFTWMHARGSRTQDTPALRCPTLLLHGIGDTILPVRVARLTGEHLPNVATVEYREFEGWGHAMIFAHGRELTRVMLDFVSRTHGVA